MQKLGKGSKKVIVLVGFLLIFVTICAIVRMIFIQRDPLVIVSDTAFTVLYGERRLHIRQFETQVRLFRPVKQAMVGDGAGDDLVSLAVQAAAKRPYCVLFPYRYAGGAAYYAAERPDIPIAVLGGGAVADAGYGVPANIPFIQTDAETDRLRAAAIEAVFAQSASADAGSSTLFSWIDPRLTPSRVKVVFDDSAWALATQSAVLARQGAGGMLPSRIWVLGDRVGSREERQFLEAAVKIQKNGEK